MERYEHKLDTSDENLPCRHCGLCDPEGDGMEFECPTLLRQALDAALAERDALRDQIASLRVMVGDEREGRDTALAEGDEWAAKFSEAEARAERARREAIEECIAAFPTKGPRSAERARARERLRAILAPEAQRPAKEGT